MSLVIDMPTATAERLTAAFGPDLSRAALEALAVEGYRGGKLSLGLVAELLGLPVLAAEALLQSRGVELLYTPADLDADLADLRAESRLGV